MSIKLTDSEIQTMAEHHWRQMQKPPEPLYVIGKLVPYSELPEVGAGGFYAAAIRGELAERGFSEDVSFATTPMLATAQCLGCGELKPAAMVDGGYCRSCEGE